MIRARITPTFTADGVHITIEWVIVGEGEQVVATLYKEEFAVARRREGCAYVSRTAFREGTILPGTFWIDESNRRHFIMEAEAGIIGLSGKQAQQATG